MYDVVSGPMVWISCGLFVAGLIVQTYRFFGMTKKKALLFKPAEPKAQPPKKGKKGKKAKKKPASWSIPEMLDPIVAWVSKPYDKVWGWFSGSVARSHPVMAITTVTFHVLLFVTPIFLFAHNTMIGWGLPSLPEGLSDFLSIIVILCCGAFLFRRLFVKRVRVISSAYDYFVLLVTAAPFVTGFMAYHQIFDYTTVILIHMIAGEAMLILIPFTRLGHALFFFLYRFFVGSEYSFGQGNRAW